jgi:hypothetical protein
VEEAHALATGHSHVGIRAASAGACKCTQPIDCSADDFELKLELPPVPGERPSAVVCQWGDVNVQLLGHAVPADDPSWWGGGSLYHSAVRALYCQLLFCLAVHVGSTVTPLSEGAATPTSVS